MVRFAAFAMIAGSALLAIPGRAAAQDPPAEAREFYARGQALYEEGRYREAIVELERAYALDPGGTILLYNIGLIYEKLGEVDRAVRYYRQYLRHDVPADERERVEGVIRRIEGARSQVEAPGDGPSGREDASDPAPQPTPRRPAEYGRADGLFWVTAGAAAVALVGGGVFGALALQNDANAKAMVTADPDDLAARQDLASRADGQALVADVAIVAAVALGAASALLYFLREAETPPASLSPAPVGSGALVVATARWP